MTDEKNDELAEETESDAVDELTDDTAAEVATETQAPPQEDDEGFEFVQDPIFDVDYKGDCAYEVRVTVPAANGKKQTEELFGEIMKEAQVPGFRKGKAPRGLVENKFGKAVRAESLEKLVGASVDKMVKETDLHPISTPKLEGLEDAKELKADEDLVFTLKFEVFPKCVLGEYRGLEIEHPVLKVDEADIDQALLDLRGRFATHEKLEGAVVGDGDQAVIDFEGKVDGEAFVGGSAQNYPYIVGSGRFFSEFDAVLRGTKVGDEVACEVDFPEDYSNKLLAGKTAHFTIKVNEVKRKTTPALDDSFAKQAGFESAEALRERIASDLRANASSSGRIVAENRAIRKIVETSTFEMPTSVIESSARQYYENARRQLVEMRVPNSEIEAREEQMRAEARERALFSMKSFVAVNEIGEAEHIEVTEDDFLKEAEAIQQRTGADMDVVSRFLSQQDQRNDYIARIFRQKAMEVIWNNAKITQNEVTRQELEAEYAALQDH